ncbi:MAG TPA: SRPBCC domain-containing protein [Acetobacteraceae bacterium]|nr:SRPBCC domain-containing protein [Acetobacteraceae bacterium]
MSASTGSAAATSPELVVSRLIDAPRALVYKAWTQSEHAARWWGPQGFTTVSCRMDARPGGAYRLAMRAPDGTMHTKRGVYREIAEPERLVFSYAWEDANGNLGHEMRVTVTFEARGQQTLLTLHQTGFEAIPERDSHQQGWTSCLERFTEYILTTA